MTVIAITMIASMMMITMMMIMTRVMKMVMATKFKDITKHNILLKLKRTDCFYSQKISKDDLAVIHLNTNPQEISNRHN